MLLNQFSFSRFAHFSSFFIYGKVSIHFSFTFSLCYYSCVWRAYASVNKHISQGKFLYLFLTKVTLKFTKSFVSFSLFQKSSFYFTLVNWFFLTSSFSSVLIILLPALSLVFLEYLSNIKNPTKSSRVRCLSPAATGWAEVQHGANKNTYTHAWSNLHLCPINNHRSTLFQSTRNLWTVGESWSHREKM